MSFLILLQTGQFQMIDTDNSDQYALFIHQIETGGAEILTFDLSASCQAFAFGDAAGKLYFNYYIYIIILLLV